MYGMEKDEVFKEVSEFIRKYNGIVINEKSKLFSDLRLIGDDADFFITRFQDKFKVDFGNLEFDKYFLREFHIPFQYWYYKKYKPEKLKRQTFTIQHLVEVVNRGKWFEPI
jgi:hypothetical protein